MLHQKIILYILALSLQNIFYDFLSLAPSALTL